MPLPSEEFQGKGVLRFSSSSSSCSESLFNHLNNPKSKPEKEEAGEGAHLCYAAAAISEPNSVLDTLRSPSPLTSSSTLSSSHGGNSGGGGAASTAVSGQNTTTDKANSSKNHSGEEKCGQMGVNDWDSVLSGSPVHEQSILRLIMSDGEDPSVGLNKILQHPSSGFESPEDSELNAVGFGAVDPTSFGLESIPASVTADSLYSSGFAADTQSANLLFSSVSLPQSVFQPQILEGFEEKPQILNPQLIINQNQAHFTQNPALFMPVHYGQLQEHFPVTPPPAKRLNQGPIGFETGFHPVQRGPFVDPIRPGLQKATAVVTNQPIQPIQQGLTDQLFKVAELIETGGDPVLAQGILARLNQQLSSPIGKPFQRAAFYFKEALQKLLHLNMMNNVDSSTQAFSSYSLILKIGAYKSFSEISPVLQFANFTCNQALLESFQGFDRVHVIDFDVGYGGQWASLIQELSLRNGGPPSMKLTVFISPLNHDDLEIAFTQENLKHFANEINISFEIEVLSIEMLHSLSWRSSEKEAVCVNLPLSSCSHIQMYLPLVLRFVKQVSPKMVVCSDRGCERTDLPFPHQLIHSLQSHSALLESLDGVNANLDTMQKIERFLIQPSIEKTVLNHSRPTHRTVPWRALFLQCGFSPLIFSNFTESQAECLVQRTPIRGFHVEKKQNSLVLCWHRKELASVSAWRC